MVAHLVWDQGAAGSNPATPTILGGVMLVLHWWMVVVIVGILVHYIIPNDHSSYFGESLSPFQFVWFMFWVMLAIIFKLAFH